MINHQHKKNKIEDILREIWNRIIEIGGIVPTSLAYSILGYKPVDKMAKWSGLCCLAEIWMPGEISPPTKSSGTRTVKGGRDQVHMIGMLCVTKCWCLVRSPDCLKECLHVLIKDLMRDVLAIQTSPTLVDAQICSQMVIHCYLSCAISYQSPSIPSILISITNRSLQRLARSFRIMPKTGFNQHCLSIFVRCPSHLHRCFLNNIGHVLSHSKPTIASSL